MKGVAVIGLGLIGGSLALSLKRRGVPVVGTDADEKQVAAAVAAGLDAYPTVQAMLASRDAPEVLVICTPLPAIVGALRETRRELTGRDTRFFHAGSLQSPDRLGLSATDARRLIGTHPLAGSHRGGFDAADAALFDGCTVLIEARASAEQRASAVELWTAAGATRLVMENAEAHDQRMSVVSHLPQLASIALALTIHERGFDVTRLGSGGRDATRLAASPAELWTEILRRSKDDAVTALARLQWNVARLRGAIDAEDWQELQTIWDQAAELFETREDRAADR